MKRMEIDKRRSEKDPVKRARWGKARHKGRESKGMGGRGISRKRRNV
jgi:hypothetical protein